MESGENLRDSALWSQEQPRRVSVVTGLVKSVRKLAGAEPRIPTPSQIEHGGGKSERDLVQQMAELRVNRKHLHEGGDDVCPRKHLFRAQLDALLGAFSIAFLLRST